MYVYLFSLSLTLSLSPFSFLDHSLIYLNLLTENLSDVSGSGCCHDNQEPVHWLTETLELVFNCLRRRREACRLRGREDEGTANEVTFVPRSAFQSFKSFILNSVDYLEAMLKVHVYMCVHFLVLYM